MFALQSIKSTLAHKGSMTLILVIPGILELLKPDTNVSAYILALFPMFVGVCVYRYVRQTAVNRDSMQ